MKTKLVLFNLFCALFLAFSGFAGPLGSSIVDSTDTAGEVYCKLKYNVLVSKSKIPANTVFNPFRDSIVCNLKITVFNRYGMKVFEAKNNKKHWDGNYDKKECPAGVYYYLATYEVLTGLGIKSRKCSGSITLLR